MATVLEQREPDQSRWRGHRTTAGLALAVLLAAVVIFVAADFLQAAVPALSRWMPLDEPSRDLRWLLALLPGAIIVNHVVYLVSSRRKQFREALGPMDETEIQRLENLYFGYGPLTVRYILPAVFVTVLCSTAIAALTAPQEYLPWLYVPTTAENAKVDVAGPWPGEPWAVQALRGAAFGFIGAYVYLLLLLTDRARQRDVTTGIAMWAAAMPVLGPIMGGVAAFLLVSGTGSSEGSFTRDAVFFIAGMLPRQFATFVQSGIRRMFENSAPAPTIRTLPLTTLRGVGPDVAARLEEEGIHDVSALAYASPHQLIRVTTYSPKQIADWIDEALLIATVPAHWDALEKVGVTGAMDLAWYQARPESIKPLADEIKMPASLLSDVVARLWQDAQVRDLYQLYWDRSAPLPSFSGTAPVTAKSPDTTGADGPGLSYDFDPQILQDARERLLSEVKTIPGVSSLESSNEVLTIVVDPERREDIESRLATMVGIRRKP